MVCINKSSSNILVASPLLHVAAALNRRHLAILNTAASGLDYLSGRGRFAGNSSSSSAWQPTAHSILLHCGLAGNSSSSSSIGLLVNNSSSSSLTSSAGALQEVKSSSLTGGLTGSLTSGECHALLEGQCMAIVSTFNVWWGLCFTTFLLVAAEQLSKWQWLHTHGTWMLPGAPALFRAGSRPAFLRALLLRLHCVLDVPLLLLWAGFSTAYIGVFGGN
jgi:hypothetical protein